MDQDTLQTLLTSSPRHAAGGFPEVLRACARFIGCCPAQPQRVLGLTLPPRADGAARPPEKFYYAFM